MSRPVIAIGFDAADPDLLEEWMEQGHLPNFSAMRERGAYGRLKAKVDYAGKSTELFETEPLWVMFSTGCLPMQTGFWSTINYHMESYGITCDMVPSGYEDKEYAPFYALGDDYRVATLDIPVSALSGNLNGLQVSGWGGHFPFTPSTSIPAQLLPDLVEKYGKNPVLYKDHGSWWSTRYLKWLSDAVKTSIDKRVAIIRDLLGRDDWDLFITVFGDAHSVGHDHLHLSQPKHPLYSFMQQYKLPDLMLKGYQQIDSALGEILAEAPDDASVLCFSLHGMQPNHQDIPTMVFLAEALYRFNFPGKAAISPGKSSEPLPPIITRPIRSSRIGEAWRLAWDTNPVKRLLCKYLPARYQRFSMGDLDSPYGMDDNLKYIPALWYRSLWPGMKAFALPAFSDGQIRINLQGRDPHGIVAADEYDTLCNELTEMLRGLRDSRSGKPMVKDVVRTRRNPQEDGPEFPPADLVVIWEEIATDVVDSPDIGRIGPITYFRAGGHRPNGFLMAQGPGIVPGTELPTAQPIDIAPTILQLMGAPLPARMQGKSLLTPDK